MIAVLIVPCAGLLPVHADSAAAPAADQAPMLTEAESLLARFFAASGQVVDYRMVMDKQQRIDAPPQ